MITIKITKGVDLVEYYIEPEEIKFLKKIEGVGRHPLPSGIPVSINVIYSIKIDNNWETIDEETFNEIMRYKNAITRQKLMDNILDG